MVQLHDALEFPGAVPLQGLIVVERAANVTLTISANGSTLLSQSFASGAAAVAYFTNHAVDLGSLTAPLYSGNVLNLNVSLDVTTSSAGSAFYGNLLIGDPPAATTASKAQGLVSALAAFGANDSHMSNEGFYSRAMNTNRPMLAAARG